MKPTDNVFHCLQAFKLAMEASDIPYEAELKLRPKDFWRLAEDYGFRPEPENWRNPNSKPCFRFGKVKVTPTPYNRDLEYRESFR